MTCLPPPRPRTHIAQACLAFFLAAFFGPGVLLAARCVEVLPLTHRILMLHFDEGAVVHHERGQRRTDEVVVVTPLDVAKAGLASSYRISSASDPRYQQGVQPTQVNRKSKGTDFAWTNTPTERAPNPDHAKEHWIYLHLSEPLQEGAEYIIETREVASGNTRHVVRYSAQTSRTEAVHVNAVGYTPAAPAKYGYIYHWMGDGGPLDPKPYIGQPFHLVDLRSGQIAFTGTLALRSPRDRPETAQRSEAPPHGNFAAADVVEADFTPFAKEGAYVLSVPNLGTSFPFEISRDVYRRVFVPVARALYHNRSGIALTAPFTDFARPAPHNPKLTPGFAHRLFYTTVRSMDWPHGEGSAKDADLLRKHRKGTIETSGWYQDAGDWDGYQQHLRVAQELLLVLEMAPKRFGDGELNIPESGNGFPDLLDEARWLPRFCYRLRQELLSKGYGTGGIGLRITGDPFGDDWRPDGTTKASWDDVDRDWVVSGEDPWSTYRYAGAAAHLALVLRNLGLQDPEGIDWEREAREAYAWAQANTRPEDERRPPVYWLYALRDPRMYAAAGLYRITGQTAYLEQFLRDFRSSPAVQNFVQAGRTEIPLDQPESALGDEQRYGPWLLLLAPDLPAEVRSEVEPIVLASAWRVGPQVCEQRAMRFGGPFEFSMLVGHQTTPQVLDCVVAYTLLKDRDPSRARSLLAAVYTSADYCLGTNPLNYTWVTGVGPRPPQHPFHMDAWYNGRGRPHPGIVPYGPWRRENDTGTSSTHLSWAFRTVHPADISEWPAGEHWFENRSTPLSNEFTVHQTVGPAAAIYGFLCADQPSDQP